MIFKHSVTLVPVTFGQSSIGAITQTYATGSTYSAFVQTRSESPGEINFTAGVRTGIVVYVLGECPAKPIDRLTYDGTTYEVRGAMPIRTPDGTHHVKITAVELDT